MGQNQSCLGSQNERRRNKRSHEADGAPQSAFAPARTALAALPGPSSTGLPPLGLGGGRPSDFVFRPRRLARRAFGFGHHKFSQPVNSTVVGDSGQFVPIEINFDPVRPIMAPGDNTAAAYSQNQDEEMVDAAASLSLLSQSQGGQPTNKRIKLEMEIDSADGNITGRVVVAARDNEGAFNNIGPDSVLMNIPSQTCAICQEQMRNVANSQEDSQQNFRSESQTQGLSLEEMNREFNRNEAHHLFTLERQLMTEVGYISPDSIVGFVKERKSIEEEILNRLTRPELFDGLRKFTTTGILISGHEANGKTTLARIIASYINYRYINVRPYFFDSDHKYERLIGVFRLARRTQPSVIIFDAADQLNQTTNQMFGRNKKLQQLFINEFRNSVQSGHQIVVIITTTSCPHTLPRGILNCFEHKIHLGLPTDEERRALLKVYMTGTNHCLSKQDIYMIADLIRGYPRGQIATLCRMAAQVPVTELIASDQAIRSVTREDFLQAIDKLLRAEFTDSQESTTSAASGRSSTTSWGSSTTLTMTATHDEDEEDMPATGHMSDVD